MYLVCTILCITLSLVKCWICMYVYQVYHLGITGILVVPISSTSILSTGLCHSPPRYRVDAAGLSFKKQTRKTSKGKKVGEVKECILVQIYDVHVRRCDNVSLR